MIASVILNGIGGMGMESILFMVALFAIMYFFMIRPQQKKQKEIQKARAAIKTGDRILTAGGIHGKIKDVKETYFVVEISEGVRIKVEKNSVYPAGSQPEENPTPESSK
jgi:preprotein translocase subunit YajC